MNKPKRENYPNICLWENYVDYSRELERYCDDLELAYKMVLRDGEKLEKALDKACDKLAFTSNEHIIEELGSFTLGEINRTKDQWKAWAMESED